jgi:hypothetical protein
VDPEPGIPKDPLTKKKSCLKVLNVLFGGWRLLLELRFLYRDLIKNLFSTLFSFIKIWTFFNCKILLFCLLILGPGPKDQDSDAGSTKKAWI